MKAPVVVGLGNPGRSYERTRHNIGFLVADELAKRHGGSWRAKKKAEAAPISFGQKNVTLLKPTTYMNNSGTALAGYKAEQLIVVHDDLDLPAGAVRVKVGGGAVAERADTMVCGPLFSTSATASCGYGSASVAPRSV